MNCPICGSPLAHCTVSEQLRIAKCRTCGHSLGSHLEARAERGDYHEQYSGTVFLDSLATTRKRQAALITGLIRMHWPDTRRLLDFGAGRGWFLDAARQAGIDTLAGADSSQVALRGIQEAGFEALEIPAEVSGADLSRLSFKPQVVTLLDVLEHFELAVGLRLLSKMFTLFEGPARFVIKVPISNGILYRLALALSSARRPTILERMYQVGTSPPHLNYFSRSSVLRYLDLAALEAVEVTYDRDFEPRQLAERARLGVAMGGIVGRIPSYAVAWTSELLGLQDSAIVLAERQGSAEDIQDVQG